MTCSVCISGKIDQNRSLKTGLQNKHLPGELWQCCETENGLNMLSHSNSPNPTDISYQDKANIIRVDL